MEAQKVLDSLALLDGTTRSAVRLLTSSSDEEIDELGGLDT